MQMAVCSNPKKIFQTSLDLKSKSSSSLVYSTMCRICQSVQQIQNDQLPVGKERQFFLIILLLNYIILYQGQLNLFHMKLTSHNES